MLIVGELGLEWKNFDLIYIGVDYNISVENNYYELNLFYIDTSNTAFIHVLCKNKKAQERLEKLLKRIKNLKGIEYLVED